MKVRNAIGATVAALLVASPLHAQLLDPFYADDYSAFDLGSITGLPTNYGGLTFLDGDTLLIGGSANNLAGRIYSVDVVRGAGGHITGFGSASLFGGPGSAIGDYNDGGVVIGPDGVLFLARYPLNQIGQAKPGSLDEDKIVAGPAGAGRSVSALNFVPSGFGGAGRLKVTTYSNGQWYDASYALDADGTFDLAYTQVDLNPDVAGIQNLPGGPEGFVYIAAGNPGFDVNGMLVAEYGANRISAYEVDAEANPVLATRRTFLSGLTGAEGAAIDPLTGDFLFSTFGGSNRIVAVQGFMAPIPEPQTYALLLAGLGLLGFAARRKRLQR